jgi:hypothetical protein
MEEFVFRARPWATLLIQHNWPILLYGALGLVAAVWAYLRPSRRAVLTLYGLLGLAFAFEYQKHVGPALRGTMRYLFSAEVNPLPRAVSQLIVADVAPVALYAAAGALLLAAAAPWRLRRRPARSSSGASSASRPAFFSDAGERT